MSSALCFDPVESVLDVRSTWGTGYQRDSVFHSESILCFWSEKDIEDGGSGERRWADPEGLVHGHHLLLEESCNANGGVGCADSSVHW